MPYIAKLEKAGIPTVLIDLEDQHNMVEQEALAQGVPNVRYLPASRTLPGPEDVAVWIDSLMEGLTKPLSDKEKESGKHEPPQDRILFEGTLDEAETFYQQTRDIPQPVNAPLSVYTDGFPIRVPTEERVKEMLTGTSRNPDEIVTIQADRPGSRGLSRKGQPVMFQPLNRPATVEKIATIAVMAGCKPEHLPVVLAIAQSGCSTGTTNFPSQVVVVSGPVVKELKLNTGCGHLGPGSPVNGPIGRSYQLMAINLGGAIPGVNRMSAHGSPLNNGGVCIAENVDGLPAGWKGLNEESGFKKEDSVVMVMMMVGNHSGMVGHQFSPGGYRAFQKSGHGGMARRLGVKGIPGPHNWLEYLIPDIWSTIEGGLTFIMIPELAQHLYECGFKTKDEVYEWLYQKSFEPVARFRHRSWPDLSSNGWMGIEKTTGKHWKELPDDHLVPSMTDSRDNCIIIAGGQEEASVQLGGGRGQAPVFSIDPWR
ncbi:hypothetical protein ACFLUP_02760 [Chloroflexota bacterium]